MPPANCDRRKTPLIAVTAFIHAVQRALPLAWPSVIQVDPVDFQTRPNCVLSKVVCIDTPSLRCLLASGPLLCRLQKDRLQRVAKCTPSCVISDMPTPEQPSLPRGWVGPAGLLGGLQQLRLSTSLELWLLPSIKSGAHAHQRLTHAAL